MNRRGFFKLVGIATAAYAAGPVMSFEDSQPDVRGWRFGVWEIIERYGVRHGQKYYSCRCDCGEERVVGLNQLLSDDSQKCHHMKIREL